MSWERRLTPATAWPSQPAWVVLQSREEFGGEGSLLSLSAARGIRERTEGEGRAPSEDTSAYRRVRTGDLVVNRLVARDGAFAVSQLDGLVSPAYWVLQARLGVDTRWVDYVLRSAPYLAEIGRISKSMPPAQFDLPWEQFRAVPIPLPQLSVQRRIADYLDTETARINKLIEAKLEILRLHQQRRLAYLEALFSESIGARESPQIGWIRRLPGDWPIVRVSQVADVFNGTTPERDDEASSGDIPWTTSGDVDQGLVLQPSGYISEAVRLAHGLRIAPVGSVVVGLVGQGRTRGLSAELGSPRPSTRTSQQLSHGTGTWIQGSCASSWSSRTRILGTEVAGAIRPH